MTSVKISAGLLFFEFKTKVNLVESSEMVMEIFNAGIIGCGKMGMQHMKVINASKRAKVIAIADPRLNSAEIRQIVGKSVETYDSAEHLFSKVRLDAVHIVTPPETHYALGKLALENGAHVLLPYLPAVATSSVL